MRARILCAAAALSALPVATWAQDGMRSASLRERPLTSTLSPARGDLFLAEPDTYTPRNDRRDAPGPFLGRIPVSWYISGVRPYLRARQGVQHSANRPMETRPRRRHPPTYPEAPTAPSERPPAAAPGVPKTFYVIAGCYAGDTPPRPEWLPPDCDPSNVRVVLP